MSLSESERERYARHLSLPGVGSEGQAKIKQARVLCVGAGGLGSPVITYLSAAGVGQLGIIDPDKVELSNLQRQTIHTAARVGELKVSSAEKWVKENNPHVKVHSYPYRLNATNALDIISHYDIIVDGTDNFNSRYLINDACFFAGKPNVQASIFRFQGQLSVFSVGNGPCYRCLYPSPPHKDEIPDCSQGGVLGVLPGLLGVIQATETLKLILGNGEALVGRLLSVDALSMAFKTLTINKDPNCPLCGEQPSILTLEESMQEIDVTALRAQLQQNPDLNLIDVREPFELIETGKIGDALNIPLNTLPDNLDKLSKDQEFIIYCRSGGRSARAVAFLEEQGFKCKNLTGGIIAWNA